MKSRGFCLGNLPWRGLLTTEPGGCGERQQEVSPWVLGPLTLGAGLFLSLMAVERPHFS